MKYHSSLLNINITSRNIIVMYGLEEQQYSNTTSLTSQFLMEYVSKNYIKVEPFYGQTTSCIWDVLVLSSVRA